MKNINAMTTAEIKAEIKNLVSLFDDPAQALHDAAYLADLADEFAKRAAEEMSE